MKTINPYKLFVGAFIPNWLLCRKEVSFGAKCVYARLCQYAGADGKCYPSVSRIAKEVGGSERYIRKLIAELKSNNLIIAHQTRNKNGFTSNLYFFLEHEWMSIGTIVSTGGELLGQQVGNYSVNKEDQLRGSLKEGGRPENKKQKKLWKDFDPEQDTHTPDGREIKRIQKDGTVELSDKTYLRKKESGFWKNIDGMGKEVS